MMNRDPELPNGYQDADFEQRDLEETGRAAARARKAGKCTHGWRQGQPCKGSGDGLDESAIEKCLYCGKTATRAALDEEAREIIDEYR